MRAAEVKVLLEIFTASIFAHERFAADAAAMSIAAENPGRRKSSRARAVRSAPRLARKRLLTAAASVRKDAAQSPSSKTAARGITRTRALDTGAFSPQLDGARRQKLFHFGDESFARGDAEIIAEEQDYFASVFEAQMQIG